MAERLAGVRHAAASRIREDSDLDRRADGGCILQWYGPHAKPRVCRQACYPSAGVIADFIVVDMVAEAASGDKSPKEAAERAAKRADRYYRV